jgi:voltage-gated potassium channel
MKRLRRNQLLAPRGLLYSLMLCLLIMLFGGLGFYFLEPNVRNLADGFWLAFTTAATVGYGDLVPSTHAARALAIIIVVLGLAVLSMVTASVAAMFVEADERQFERDMRMHIQNLQAEVQKLRALLESQCSTNNEPNK